MSELFSQFGVEWKLLVAQIVNFAILFFLLRKFAYGPILSIMRERRKMIQEGLEAASESQKKLEEAGKEKDAIVGDARKESLSIVQEGERLAKEKVRYLLDAGQKQAADIVEEGKMRSAEEKLKMKEEVMKESSEFLKSALARIVEKSPASLDDNLIKGVVSELKQL